MKFQKIGLGAAALASAGAVIAGAAMANASTPAATPLASYAAADSSTAPTGDATTPTQGDRGATDTAGATDGRQDNTCGPGGGRGGQGMHQHTEVTGDEAAKVTAAVTAKDSGVTVTTVRKDPDGSYDVFGTKDGAKVMYEVSADLATVTQNQRGGPGGPGGPGGADDQGGRGGHGRHGQQGATSDGGAQQAPNGTTTPTSSGTHA